MPAAAAGRQCPIGRGAASFLTETFGRVRPPAPPGADLAGDSVSTAAKWSTPAGRRCALLDHRQAAQRRYPHRYRCHRRVRLVPIPYFADAPRWPRFPICPSPQRPAVPADRAPVKPTPALSWPCWPPTPITRSSPTVPATCRTRGRPSPPRRGRKRHPRSQIRGGLNHLPSGGSGQRRLAGLNVIAHNLARCTSRIGLARR